MAIEINNKIDSKLGSNLDSKRVSRINQILSEHGVRLTEFQRSEVWYKRPRAALAVHSQTTAVTC
jgi:uncharacterized protein YbaP (TraB family)